MCSPIRVTNEEAIQILKTMVSEFPKDSLIAQALSLGARSIAACVINQEENKRDDYQKRTTGDAEALNQLCKQFTTSVSTSDTENELNNITTCPQDCEICDKYEKSCFGGIETTSSKAIISHRKPLESYYDYEII